MEAALNSNLKLLQLPNLSISTWETTLQTLLKDLDPEFAPLKKELKPKALKLLEMIMKIRKSDLDDYRHSRFHRVLLILTTMIMSARTKGIAVSKENMFDLGGVSKQDLVNHQTVFMEKSSKLKKVLSNYEILRKKLDSFEIIDSMVAEQEDRLKELVDLHGPIEKIKVPVLSVEEKGILDSIQKFEEWIENMKECEPVEEVVLDAKELEVCLSLDKKRDLSGLNLYSNGKLNLSAFVDML